MATKAVTVGVDGSEESLRAVEWAALEARRQCGSARTSSCPGAPAISDTLKPTSCCRFLTSPARVARAASNSMFRRPVFILSSRSAGLAAQPARAEADLYPALNRQLGGADHLSLDEQAPRSGSFT
jgi:hypothetical protein